MYLNLFIYLCLKLLLTHAILDISASYIPASFVYYLLKLPHFGAAGAVKVFAMKSQTGHNFPANANDARKA